MQVVTDVPGGVGLYGQPVEGKLEDSCIGPGDANIAGNSDRIKLMFHSRRSTRVQPLDSLPLLPFRT